MGTFLGVPHNKDYSILGSILGFPYFGKLPFRVEGLGSISTPHVSHSFLLTALRPPGCILLWGGAIWILV